MIKNNSFELRYKPLKLVLKKLTMSVLTPTYPVFDRCIDKQVKCFNSKVEFRP